MKMRVVVGLSFLLATGLLIASIIVYNQSEYKGYRANLNYYQEAIEEINGQTNNSSVYMKATITATKKAAEGALNNIKKNMEPYENKFHFLLYSGILFFIIACALMIVVIVRRIRSTERRSK